MKNTNKPVQEYVASIPFDRQLYRQDIEGSIAHARVLAKQGHFSTGRTDSCVWYFSILGDTLSRGRSYRRDTGILKQRLPVEEGGAK